MFNVAIIGSQGAGSYETFKKKCVFFLHTKVQEGITILATEEHDYIKRFASEFMINVQYFYTDWRAYGRNALKERNKQLISNCSAVICFNDGLKDTEMIKNLAEKTGIPTRFVKLYKKI